jgi:hypothetical protein
MSGYRGPQKNRIENATHLPENLSQMTRFPLGGLSHSMLENCGSRISNGRL